ncbi:MULTISPECIES: NACHT domain-containing protein [unclassified Nostoc]|uniref:NACHT domain-containing protein n=1 Tax=unclassified Nostoc TaxID=2593658 RepID=UPI000DECDBD4|nr:MULTISPECIES: NACHT domain-containing protein [unclassified Nostoc]MBE8989185.1 NACHT domain-containing protein [Nostoc sp. LEGE 12450]QHG15690.1 NACHT domain-containing protein [Nostoc sp. ATCC 53789]RCJ25131.1 histidine kinase [Nostoc sp. ATCC 53789]
MTGMEPWAISAVSGVAAMFVQIGGQVLGGLGKTLNEKTKKLIFAASNEYQKKYEERHGIIKVLGMREHVKLESLYTAVQFLDDDTSFQSIENLENVYRQTKIRRFQSQDGDKQEGIKVANDKQYLMVIGGSGAGKSTFLRKMGIEALKGKKEGFKHACIPVFIVLERFASSKLNIETFIAEEFGICGCPSPERFAAKALEEGKLLILLDGLDEVPTKNLTEAISEIQNFVDKYDKNRFIISCRGAAYRHNFRRFTDVAMADFGDIQIESFISNWFRSEPDRGKDCWQKLNSPEHTAAKELTHTPLLLTLVCLLYQRSHKFPTNRATIYERALRVLLEEWADEKIIVPEDLYKGLNTKRKEMMLSEIAHDAFQQDRLFLPRREIADKIEKLLAEMLPDEKFISGADVLRSVEVQHGVLVERTDGIYSFSHLTLQEYFTARYINDHRQVEKLVTEHLTDERWNEVFLLVAELMGSGADELLLLMQKEAQKYINTPKLQALLNWAEQVTVGSVSNLKPVRKRASAITRAYINAIAIANAIANTYTNANINANAIARTKTYANAIANANANVIVNANAIASTIANANIIANADPKAIAITIKNSGELKKSDIFNNVNFTMLSAQLEALKATIPDEKQPREVRRAFAKHLQQTLLKAFHLTLEMIDLSEEEIKALENYLYANHLIIQCKQAAVRVSPQTWEAIEARMLLVPGS